MYENILPLDGEIPLDATVREVAVSNTLISFLFEKESSYYSITYIKKDYLSGNLTQRKIIDYGIIESEFKYFKGSGEYIAIISNAKLNFFQYQFLLSSTIETRTILEVDGYTRYYLPVIDFTHNDDEFWIIKYFKDMNKY
jgi:hypothetical protein